MSLLEKRKEKGLSQEQLASMVGVSRPFISQIETGEHSPSVKTAVALAKALECTVDELLRDDDDSEK